MSRQVAHGLSRLLDWLVPRTCLGCMLELDDGAQWCRRCFGDLERNEEATLHGLPLIAPFRHAGPIREAIHRLKYSGRSDYAHRLVLGGFASRPPCVSPNAILVPVPLHALRLFERGYNQAALLARALARRWGLRCDCRRIRRIVATRSQVNRNRDERHANMCGAFLTVEASGDPIWLVDDVVTTGATTLACGESLRAAGAKLHGTIALARATSGRSQANPGELGLSPNGLSAVT